MTEREDNVLKISNIVAILFLCGITLSCSIKGGFSLAQSFFYPENTGKTYTDWKYYGQIDIWDTRLEKKPRKIDLAIQDRNKKSILKGTLNITGKEVNAAVFWTEFEKIKIDFYEGLALPVSQYKSLKQDKIIREVIYQFDSNTGKFKRSVQ